jgi:hypothetical protein
MTSPEKKPTTPHSNLEQRKTTDSAMQNALKFAALLIGLAALGYVLLKVLPDLMRG